MKNNAAILLILFGLLVHLNVFGAGAQPVISIAQQLANAIAAKDITGVEQALSTFAGHDITFPVGKTLNTPLHLAAHLGRFDIVKKLTDYLADELHLSPELVAERLNIENIKKHTPLSMAADAYDDYQNNKYKDPDAKKRDEYWEIIKHLKELGARITPDMAAQYEVLDYVQKFNDASNLATAIENDDAHRVAAILSSITTFENTPFLNSFKANNRSILTLAVEKSNPLIVNLISAHFKKNEVIMNVENEDGTTALSTAATYYKKSDITPQMKSNYEEIIKILLKHGSAIRPQDITEFPFLEKMKEVIDAEEKSNSESDLTQKKDTKKHIDFTQNEVQEFDKDAEISSSPITTKQTQSKPIVKGRK